MDGIPIEHFNTFPDQELARKILKAVEDALDTGAWSTPDHIGALTDALKEIETLCKQTLEQDTSTTDVTAIYWKRANGSTGTFVSSNGIEINEKLDRLVFLQASNEIHDITISTHPLTVGSSSPEKDNHARP